MRHARWALAGVLAASLFLASAGFAAIVRPVGPGGRRGDDNAGRTRPTDEQVDKCIAALQQAILKHQVDHWTLWMRGRDAALDPAERAGGIKGTLVSQDDVGIRFKGDDGKEIEARWEDVTQLLGPGHFEPENNGYLGGWTSMAMWSLLCSGIDLKTPNMKKAVDGYINSSPMRQTYSESFRLNALSYLLRWGPKEMTANARPVLTREADIMVKAMTRIGTYTYTCYPPLGYKWERKGWVGEPFDNPGDHSNAQFGVFAVWAAEDAFIEIPWQYWQIVDTHWRESQQNDGGWNYINRNDRTTMSMTDAGMNSLYLVVDKLYSRQGDGYKRLQGFHYSPQATNGMRQTFTAINKGWAWYDTAAAKDLTTRGGWQHYAAYGMQRLGLASGRKMIGGRNWFEEVVDDAYIEPDEIAQRNPDIQDLSWRLMCLAFGRAPVLFNKLEHGNEQDWNYYFRDAANLTDWIGHELEKRYNWQIVSLKDEQHDLQDAPILIISGSQKLELTDPEKAKLRKFCDLGGTVFLHPNLNAEAFKTSAKDLFVKLYKDEGYEWTVIAKDHALYTANGKPAPADKILGIPLRGMSDGGRYFAILCEGDIAGAWQLRETKTADDVHRLMLNLRLYAADDYEDLPGRLRAKAHKPAADARRVTLARLAHKGHSTANRLLYEAMESQLADTGLALDVKDQVAAKDLAGAAIIHITGNRKFALDDAEKAAIKQAIEKGSFLLIDPAAGQPEALDSEHDLVKSLGLESKAINTKTDALLANVELKPNRWGRDAVNTGRALRELRLGDKRVGLLCDVDITAAATGDHLWGSPGLTRKSARQLLVNIVAIAAGAAPAVPAP